jgi:hypothetical protein
MTGQETLSGSFKTRKRSTRDWSSTRPDCPASLACGLPAVTEIEMVELVILAATAMFYYRPPKSSIWGHRFRNISAARASRQLERFLATATASYRYGMGSLTCLGVPGGTARFENLLGLQAHNNFFHHCPSSQLISSCELHNQRPLARHRIFLCRFPVQSRFD